MIRVTLMVVFGMSLLSAADEEGTDRKPGASGRSQPVTIEVIKLEGQTATVRAKGRNFHLKVGPGVTLKVGDRGRVELSEDKTILGFSSETSRENESNEGRIKEPDGTNKAGADSRSKKGSKPQSSAYSGPNKDLYEAILEELAEKGKKGEVDIPFFGGSFVQGWTRRNANRPEWEKLFATLGAVNCGIGGETSDRALWRLQNGSLDGYQAKVVVLFSIGANDVTNGDLNVDTTIKNIRSCVAEVKQRQPQAAILLVPTPDVPEMVAVVKPRNAAEGIYDRYALQNKAMADMDDGKGVFYLRAFDEELKKRGPDLAEEMKEIMRTTRDPHTTRIMYEVANETIHNALVDILAKRVPVRGTGKSPGVKKLPD